MNLRPTRTAETAENTGITTAELLRLVKAATRAIEVNRDQINALNVFPVPDGDTGTNMFLTLRSINEEMDSAPRENLSLTTARMARAALLGARGNSGLILAQFFKGMAQALRDGYEVSGAGFANAMRFTTENAYAAVPNPREGTMLTVFRECADAAERAVRETPGFEPVLAASASQALDTTRRTPEMLDILQEAGVVDSGGFGFTIMLFGALEALRGEGDGGVIVAPPAVGDRGSAASSTVRAEFALSAQEEIWGYCTVFAIEGEGLDLSKIRSKVTDLGRSAVVAGDETLVKIHVHMEDPGQALSFATSMGTISNIDIKNMDEQTKEWAAGQTDGDAETPTETIPLAVVAVAAGAGMQNLFINAGLETCSVVTGGDSMNPSVGDLLEAVEQAPSDNVLLLPNNKNVVGTAGEVPGLTSKTVRVIPTVSMQHGIAAMLALSPDDDIDSNAAAMNEALETIQDGAVFRATRDVSIGGVDVVEGQYTGLVDGSVRCCGEDLEAVLLETVSGNAEEGSLVTLYRGEDVNEEQANGIAARLEETVPGIEVEAVDGGQPHYEFLVSIE
jgi:DAK2 domain fusion protein YloV